MKLKSHTVLAMFFLLIVSSCSNDDNNSQPQNINGEQDCFINIDSNDVISPLPFTIIAMPNDLLGKWKILKRGYANCDGTANLVEQQPSGECETFRYLVFNEENNGQLKYNEHFYSIYNVYTGVIDNNGECAFRTGTGYSLLPYQEGSSVIAGIAPSIYATNISGFYIVEFTPTTLKVIKRRNQAFDNDVFLTLGGAYSVGLGLVTTANLGKWEFIECIKVE